MPSGVKCFKRFFKHTWHPQQMVVVPSPSSMWDYPFPCPYLDQICAGNVRPVFCTGPDPDQDFFPSKTGSSLSTIPMENTSFDGPKSVTRHTSDMELGEVKVAVPMASVATATPTASPSLPEGIPCGNGGCKTSRSRGEPRPESPWHQLKTIFLIIPNILYDGIFSPGYLDDKDQVYRDGRNTPKQISPTSAADESRQTQGALLVKRSELDKLRSQSLIKFLSRMPEVLDIRAEFLNNDSTQEWDVLAGSAGPTKSAEAEADADQSPSTSDSKGNTDKSAARTKDNLILRFHNQDDDNVQPGPSTINSPKLKEKVNRATTSSKPKEVQTRGAGVQMQTISSSERLATDEMDSSSISSMETQRRSRQLLVGWDTFRSRTMLLLIGLLVVWAIIYFPLILA